MKKILIVSAPFYSQISDMLLKGAMAELEKQNFDYETIEVAGAFEIPAAIAFAQQSENYIGYVALGCVIRGQTTHYDYVCQESARGLNELGYKNGLAIGYGIITCENEKQALERADIERKNKGGFAANACLKMVKLKERFIIAANTGT
jgi:6,7-dimethyl-8-ribityllumazine synthase